VLSLVEYYVKNSGKEEKNVWVDDAGRTHSFVFLKNGFRKSVASLKHLCRVEVNKSKLLGVDNVLIPGSLREYLNEYPFVL